MPKAFVTMTLPTGTAGGQSDVSIVLAVQGTSRDVLQRVGTWELTSYDFQKCRAFSTAVMDVKS